MIARFIVASDVLAMSANNISPVNDTSFLSPAEARAVFRRNAHTGLTSVFCPGYEQANVAIIPEHMVADFEEYCRRNEAPLPLLFRSQPGEHGAPPLATDSDIRTDLPLYDVFNNGSLVDTVQDLSDFAWNKYSAFYFGCSWSFEVDLESIGVPSSQLGDNYAMFHSNIMCAAVGQWPSCPMIVTMKYIPVHLLGKVAAVTACYPQLHGAPVHIGHPSLIGVTDVRKPDFGNAMREEIDSIPVFWGCGATVLSAIEAAKPQLAFTHHPGCMFITDKLKSPLKLQPLQMPEVIIVKQAPIYASMLSSAIHQLIAKAETISTANTPQAQEGSSSQFVKAVLALSQAHSVAVMGIGDNINSLPSVLVIAKALSILGKQVILISDASNKQLVADCVLSTMLSTAVSIVDENELLGQEIMNKFNSFVSISKESSLAVQCVKELFQKVYSDTAITTIHISQDRTSDKLGRVAKQQVELTNASLHQLQSADCTITSATNHLGALGLITGLQLATNCSVHCRYKQRGVMPAPAVTQTPGELLPTNEQINSLFKYLSDNHLAAGINLDMLSTSLQQPLEELRALVSEL